MNFAGPLLSLHATTSLAGQLARVAEQSRLDAQQNSALVASSGLLCPTPSSLFCLWFHSTPIAQHAMLLIVD